LILGGSVVALNGTVIADRLTITGNGLPNEAPQGSFFLSHRIRLLTFDAPREALAPEPGIVEVLQP
jgi:hypothetical protein